MCMQEYAAYIASYLQNREIVILLLDMRDIYGQKYLLILCGRYFICETQIRYINKD